jgi:osmotically-inducible protein OsmY
MKRTIISIALMAGLSASAMANENRWENETQDAWIDGKAEATLLFNTQFNSFDINTDVNQGRVTLTGKVQNEVNKQLATELVMGIVGVTGVDNKLTVTNTRDNGESEDGTMFVDAKIKSVINSRLLFNTEISAFEIDVEVEDRAVTLLGSVGSEAERELVVNIAKNTNDVDSVVDNLIVNAWSKE